MEEMLAIYCANHSLYADFTTQMQQIVSVMLQKGGIRVQSVMARVKSPASLQQKILSRNKYSQLEDITDLCGLRIITYFESDVEQIGTLLKEKLEIDQQNSVDKRKLLAPNQFGYLSLHLVASLPAAILQLPQYIKYKHCKIEIQICSMLQHAWAEIEHDLAYKAPAISYATRRRFSRLAGLLEMADEEFNHLREELQPLSQPIAASTPMLPDRVSPEAGNILTNTFGSLKHKILQLPLSKTACTLFLALAIYFAIDNHMFPSLLLALKTEKQSLFALVTACFRV